MSLRYTDRCVFFFMWILLLGGLTACSDGIRLGRMHRVAVLPQNVHETSGLVFFEGKLFMINDGGNSASVYRFDIGTYSSNTEFSLIGARNIDWEDVAVFDSSLVVADIGNNVNTRDTFSLYSFPMKDVTSNSVGRNIVPRKITFTIPDKPKADQSYVRSAFDMEAAVQLGAKFYVFTKNWTTEQSVAYELSSLTSGEAVRGALLPFRGLVTSVCVLPDSLLAFVGYHAYTPFVAICRWGADGFSLVRMRRFWGHWACQTEGICFVPNYGLLISAEKTGLRHQALYRVRLK